jgi:crossover junction endodeoxyribonuclease RuvC
MKILGIDPGLTKAGWGLIEASGSKIHYLASGTLKTNANEALSKRLGFLSNSFKNIIETHKPERCSMEEVFINVNALSSIKLCHARGAIMSVIGGCNLPLYEYAPNKIKKTISGAGKADKSQIIYMVNMIVSGADIQDPDEADAIATAYTCFAMVGDSNVIK